MCETWPGLLKSNESQSILESSRFLRVRIVTPGDWSVSALRACELKLSVSVKRMRAEKISLLLNARNESISFLLIVESSSLNLH